MDCTEHEVRDPAGYEDEKMKIGEGKVMKFKKYEAEGKGVDISCSDLEAKVIGKWENGGNQITGNGGNQITGSRKMIGDELVEIRIESMDESSLNCIDFGVCDDLKSSLDNAWILKNGFVYNNNQIYDTNSKIKGSLTF